MQATLSVKELVQRYVDAVKHHVADEVHAEHQRRLDELAHLLRGDNHRSLAEYLPDVEYFISPAKRYAELLEALPIDSEGIRQYSWMGFALCAGKWVPCYNYEVNWENGFAMCGIGYEGRTESIAMSPGFWAHATADNQPHMPWAWGDDDPVPDAWRK